MNTIRLSFWATAAMCAPFLCSCATRDSVRSVLPAEVSFNREAGSGGLWGDFLFVTLRLESGEELLFNVDTGAPVTVLDKSLTSRLGKRLGERQLHYAWRDRTAGTSRFRLLKWLPKYLYWYSYALMPRSRGLRGTR